MARIYQTGIDPSSGSLLVEEALHLGVIEPLNAAEDVVRLEVFLGLFPKTTTLVLRIKKVGDPVQYNQKTQDCYQVSSHRD